MRRVFALILVGAFFSVSAVVVMAQDNDKLVACIEEVKQIIANEGPQWFEKNKTSCLGEGVVGKFSVLSLTEFGKKEFFGDMELEFFAFFDTPVAGVEAREGQMEYQETSESKSPGPGYRTEKKVEKPGIGDKSQHLIETTYVNIAEGFGLPTTWAGYTSYQELMVVVGSCSFMVGGRAIQGNGWSSNHHVDWKRDVVINSDHDHGEEKLKQTMREYARSVVGRVAGVCGDFGDGGKTVEAKKGGVVDWAKGLLEKRETVVETKERPLPTSGGYWEKVEFVQWAEGANNKVNNWIIENLGVSEMKIEATEKKPSSPPAVERIVESRLLPGAVIKNYRDGVIVELDKGGWVYIPPKGKIIYASDQWRKYFDILSGEAEIETNGEDVGVRTPNAVIKTKGTRYRVAVDSSKRATTVEVYEGEVEITARDGKTASLVADNGRPEMMVISQKWSLAKLGAAGLVTVGGVGALLLVMRRRGASKGILKVKRKGVF